MKSGNGGGLGGGGVGGGGEGGGGVGGGGDGGGGDGGGIGGGEKGDGDGGGDGGGKFTPDTCLTTHRSASSADVLAMVATAPRPPWLFCSAGWLLGRRRGALLQPTPHFVLFGCMPEARVYGLMARV